MYYCFILLWLLLYGLWYLMAKLGWKMCMKVVKLHDMPVEDRDKKWEDDLYTTAYWKLGGVCFLFFLFNFAMLFVWTAYDDSLLYELVPHQMPVYVLFGSIVPSSIILAFFRRLWHKPWVKKHIGHPGLDQLTMFMAWLGAVPLNFASSWFASFNLLMIANETYASETVVEKTLKVSYWDERNWSKSRSPERAITYAMFPEMIVRPKKFDGCAKREVPLLYKPVVALLPYCAGCVSYNKKKEKGVSEFPVKGRPKKETVTLKIKQGYYGYVFVDSSE